MSLDFNEEQNYLKSIIHFLENELKYLTKHHLNIKKNILNQRRKMNDNDNWMPNTDDSNAVDNAQDLTYLRLDELKYNRNEEKIKIYKRLLNCPYFGKVILQEESIYIGTKTITDDDYNILIYDWRSPVASLYYENEIGCLSYKTEDGNIVYEQVNGRRQFRIKNGKLLNFIDSDIFIGDSELINYKIKSSNHKLSNIVSTIQKNQNEVIRLPINKDILVLGPPGSGKTAIAMQRIAYLLFKYKSNITHDNLMLLAPNSIFNDYVSDVLPELGERNIEVYSLISIVCKILYFKNIYIESKEEMIERVYSDKNAHYLFYKKLSVNFYDFMLSELSNQMCKICFNDILNQYNQKIITKSDLKSIYTKFRVSHDLPTSIQKTKNVLLDLYKKEYRKMYEKYFKELNNKDNYIGEKVDIELQAKKKASQILKRTNNMIKAYRFIDISSMYKHMCSKYQVRCQLKKDDMLYEDFWAQIWLYTKMIRVSDSRFKHILIDEVQDYNFFQLDIIRQLFPEAHFTFLGDINQNFLPRPLIDFSKWSVPTKQLTTSYRSTKAINRYLDTLKHTETEVVGEEGEPVVEIKQASFQKLLDIIKEAQGFVAVVVPSKKMEKKLYQTISDKIEIHLVDENDSFIFQGHVIIPYYLVKGFEYNTIISWNHNNYKNKSIEYIIGSRAISKLYLINTEKSTNKEKLI
ncbi:HelD family protein [Mammaliicoccus lentus]|uniref:HelD family protein n=1 Tax=Mammaliicoccus lentus TaxID=42858 RepID=UPI0026481F13|nr:UvrD-helicase domain-containing protein [Mammaliicoccus lentus]